MRIHTLDLHFLGIPGLIASYLVESGGEYALIETGPGSTLETLRSAIRAAGVDESVIKKVFVTHIHLDHAGAAGWFAQIGATIYCHPNAARHLIDPTKLIGSARMVYGDQMDALWGKMLPAPAGLVIALQDEERVKLGEVEIIAWNTPGHARHHHAFIIGDVCFPGDVAGARLENSRYLSVTAAPPQFDPVAYVHSVDRLTAAGFQSLYLTHFGRVDDVEWHLSAYRKRITEIHARVAADFRSGVSAEENRTRYATDEHEAAMRAGVDEALWQKCERANLTSMCADGVRLFCEKEQ
ncbi:MBL fold metallo-hydrolase [Prosthecobacter sp.]|uniref:MBL fold metallo-hydrolase n=1 Tax=Prosthecobacter sp. TaxID=1965333 RepID=UPI002ABB11D8|nr:MBL fold metallo-hydrolase [Prosthecobacter sp.]MDZ4406323.1 MBL fold metallo-hydrolase [Prosthecobacter sp.]